MSGYSLLSVLEDPRDLDRVRAALGADWKIDAFPRAGAREALARGHYDCVLGTTDWLSLERDPPLVLLVDAYEPELLELGAEDFLLRQTLDGLDLVLRQAIERRQARTKLESLNQRLLDLNQDLRDNAFEQADRLRGLYDDAPVGYLTLDPAGLIVEVNQTCAALLGRSRGSLQGTILTDYLSPESGVRLLEHLAADQASGRLALCLNDSQARPVQLSSRAWKVGLTHAALVDISDRVHGEEALATRQAIVGILADAVLTVTPEGAVESVNPAALRLFRAAESELVGRPIVRLFPDHDGLFVSGHRDVPGLRPDGTWFPALVGTAIVNPGSTARYVLVVRDISDARQSRQRFAAIVERERRRIGRDLHDDLGQLLTALAYMAELVEDKLPAEARKLGRRVTELAREGVGKTRSLSRGLYPFTLESQGLGDALRELASTTQAAVNLRCAARISIEGTVPEALHLPIYRLAQEAVGNAVKHARASCVWINLESTRTRLNLTVTDDGRGLPVPLEPGLGMGDMRHHAELMGATFRLESRPEGGTVLSCRLGEMQLAVMR